MLSWYRELLPSSQLYAQTGAKIFGCAHSRLSVNIYGIKWNLPCQRNNLLPKHRRQPNRSISVFSPGESIESPKAKKTPALNWLRNLGPQHATSLLGHHVKKKTTLKDLGCSQLQCYFTVQGGVSLGLKGTVWPFVKFQALLSFRDEMMFLGRRDPACWNWIWERPPMWVSSCCKKHWLWEAVEVTEQKDLVYISIA